MKHEQDQEYYICINSVRDVSTIFQLSSCRSPTKWSVRVNPIAEENIQCCWEEGWGNNCVLQFLVKTLL